MAPTSSKPRFTQAIASAGPNDAARYEFWAPKIGRRVTLFTPLQVRIWTLLEGTPRVTAYCERPAYWQHDGGKLLPDFWVKAGRREACWIITSDSQPEGTETLSLSEEIEMRYIDVRSLASRSVWIENWIRILPYLSANARFVSDRLMRDMEQASSSGPTLGEIERDFQPHDIVLVRTAVLMLLHQGRVKPPALRERALDSRTVFRSLRP